MARLQVAANLRVAENLLEGLLRVAVVRQVVVALQTVGTCPGIR